MSDRSPPPSRHAVHIIGALTTGGAERSLVNYLQAADTRDFRHTVVCIGARGELAPVVEAAGFPVIVLRIRRRYLLFGYLRLVLWLQRNRVDVIHAHMFEAALWARLAGRVAGVPVVVVTQHGPEMWKSAKHLVMDRWLNRWTSRHIAVAQDGLELRVRRERVHPDRILLIPNGVVIPATPRDPKLASRTRAHFGIDPDTPLVGSVGRMVEDKGYEHMLEALKLARALVPGLRWLAVGDGPLLTQLKAKAAAMGFGDAVIWAGLRQDVDAILPAMDVWAMSSVREGLPVALIEAMGTGCPIVATTAGGIPDAVTDGQEALLVPAGDAGALADAIVRLLHDRTSAIRLGDQARLRCEAHYSIRSVARRIEAIYREELARS